MEVCSFQNWENSSKNWYMEDHGQSEFEKFEVFEIVILLLL